MLDFVYDIVKWFVCIVSVITTVVIPAIIVWIKKIKKLGDPNATAEDKENVINEMTTTAMALIVNAENMFKGVDKLMKGEGGSTGAVKKETVMSKLRMVAMEKSIIFDEEYWSKVVDDIVAMTKQVNV